MNQWFKVFLISNATLKEVLKSKILINVVILGICIAVATYVASEFTYGVPSRVALDMGLGTLSLSANAISLLLGVGLVAKEIESRTIYVVISRPVSRWAFLVGKVLGLSGVLILNILLLSFITLSTVVILGGQLDPLVFWAIAFTLLEALLLLMLVICLSLVSNQVITVIVAIVFLFAGHAAVDVMDFSVVKRMPELQILLRFYHLVLPGFYKLNIKEFIVYEKTLPLSYLFTNFLYGMSYTVALLFLSIQLLNRKNLD